MTQCEAPIVNRINVCDADVSRIKEILNTDTRSPLIAFTFDKFGNVNFFTSEEEFNKSPFDLRDQRFRNIVSASFITTEGSHNVTVSVGGESSTSSLPF